jgi:hypothetical protein
VSVPAAPTTPPPLSVSRPLRLSATPSQPRSERNEEQAVSHTAQRSVVDVADVKEAEEELVAYAMQPSLFAAQSTPPRTGVSGVDREVSSNTVVSFTSVAPQASVHPLQQQQQQSPPPHLDRENPASAPPSDIVAPTSASAPASTPVVAEAAAAAAVIVPPSSVSPPDSFLDADGTLPSLSDIVAADGATIAPAPLEEKEEGEEDVPARHPPRHRDKQQLQSPIKDETPLLSRLRSPTPDGPALERETVVAPPEALPLNSPLERPRPSQSSVDEPPPRAVREESPPSQPGSHPKARSTTARPPSTPPAAPSQRTHPANASQPPAAKPTASYRGHGARRAASDDSNDDEATLFFREPPRGVVREVVAPTISAAAPTTPDVDDADDGTHLTDGGESRVEVGLLDNDFVLPSSKGVAHTAAATTLFPPPRTPTVPAGQTQAAAPNGRQEEEVSHSAPQDHTPLEANLPTHRVAQRSNSPSDLAKATKDESAGAATLAVSNKDEVAKKRGKARSRSPRSRRVIDEDDEPSLQFTAPPQPRPLPPPTSLPRPASAARVELEADKDFRSTAACVSAAASHETSPRLASLPSVVATPTETGPSAVTPTAPAEQQEGGPAHRPLHQPRRPNPTDAAPRLAVGDGSVAPPRLQRSASPSASPSSAATPLADPSATGLAGPLGSHADVPTRPTLRTWSSADRPVVTDLTPALPEPQRTSPASRAAFAAASSATSPTSAAADARTVTPLASVLITADSVLDRAAAPHETDEEVETIDVRSRTATPNRASCHAPTPVVAADDDVEVTTAPRTEAGSTSAGSKININASQQTPGNPPKSESLDTPPSPSSSSPWQLQQHQDSVTVLPAVEVSAVSDAISQSSSGIGLPHDVRNDNISSLSMSMSQPADPLPASPGQPQGPPGRAGGRESRSGGTSPRRVGQGGSGSEEPAPLPTVNVDAPESNTLGLPRRASPHPAPSSNLSMEPLQLPRGSSTPIAADAVSSLPSSSRSRSGQSLVHSRSNSTLNNSPNSEAAAKRREDVTRILERIRAKRVQEQKSGAGTPTTATVASPTSFSRHESEDPLLAEE